MARPLRVLLILLVVIGGLYTAGWFAGAWVVKDRIATEIAALEAQGYDVQVDGLDITGYPARFDVEVPDYAVETPAGLMADGGALTGGVSVVDFLTGQAVELTAAGRQQVAVPGALIVDLAGADGRLELAGLTEPRAETGRLVARDIRVQPGSGAPDDEAPALTIANLVYRQAEPLRRPDGTADPDFGGVSLSLAEIGLPVSPVEGLPATVERLEADLAVALPWPLPPRQSVLAGWRDAGGEIQVQRAHLAWGEIRVTVEGTLRLDEALQPEGRLDASVNDVNRVLEIAARRSGGTGSGLAGLTGLGGGLLGGFGGGGGGDTDGADGDEGGGLTLPLTIGDGRVRLGPIEILRLPPIQWPEG